MANVNDRFELSDNVSAHVSEIERIRSEYARRERELPNDLYSWDRQANLFFHCQTVRTCVAMLSRERMFPLDGKSVVDIGCGAGTWLLEFLQWGAPAGQLAGI